MVGAAKLAAKQRALANFLERSPADSKPSLTESRMPPLSKYVLRIQPFLRLLIMRQGLESGKYSDLKIKCGTEEFAVHKVILCTQSPVLQAAMEHDFAVSPLLEHSTRYACDFI